MNHRVLPLVVSVLASLGCAQSDGPEPRTQAEITSSHLARELPPGAAQLAPFVERLVGDPTSAELVVLTSRDRATGHTLADVSLEPPRDSLGMRQASVAALFRVDATGGVRLLRRIAEGVVPSGVVVRRAVPGVGAIVSCTATEANGVRLEGDAPVPFDDAPAACRSADLAGESLRPGRWLSLERTDATLVVVSRSVRGEAPESKSLPLPDVAARFVWAREASDGAIEVVTRGPTGFEWRRESGAPVTLAVDNPDGQRIAFDEALDAFVLRAPDGAAIVWAPQRASEQRLAAPTLPEGAAAWIHSGSPLLSFAEVSVPNPRYTPVRVPQRYVVSAIASGALQSSDARLTPCADHARCRALGESYLLGTIDGRKPLGIYVFWSWESLATLFAAPLLEGPR